MNKPRIRVTKVIRNERNAIFYQVMANNTATGKKTALAQCSPNKLQMPLVTASRLCGKIVEKIGTPGKDDTVDTLKVRAKTFKAELLLL